MLLEVLLYPSWSNLHDKSPNISPLEYHEECGDSDESPVGNYTTNSSHDRYTTTCKWSYLCCYDWLDISGILLDDIECMFDIVLTQDEEDNLLDIWMKVESMNTISKIYCLSTIDPVDDNGSSLCDVLDDDWYQCPDDDTTEDEYDYIYPYECHPWWDFIPFSELDKGIHHHSNKSCYHEYKDNRRYRPESIESCYYHEEDEDFLDPEREFVCHELDC